MKFLLLVALAGAVFADKDVMLKENRVVANDVATSVGTTCDECQSLVKRFVAAAHDQAKMNELKMLLRVLCHETSYVEECNVFVNNLDSLIKKLEPYLADAKKVCKGIHLCSNSRLDAFHRIGLLYVKKTMDQAEGLKDLVCDECQLAANEIKKLVDDKEKQKEIRDFLSNNVCVYAGSHRGMCDMLVEQFLPEVFEELDVILKDTKKACADLGFCARVSTSPRRLEVIPTGKHHPVLELFKKGPTVQTSKGPEVLVSCLECRSAVDLLLVGLEDDRNSQAAGFQKLVCEHVLPKNFTPSCEDFMSMYLPTVLYMTYQQFSGEGVCTNMHCCDSGSNAALNAISKNEMASLATKSCSTFQSFIKESFNDQLFKINAVALAQEAFCEPAPQVLQSTCYGFFEALVPKFLSTIAVFSQEGRFCAH